MSVRQWLLAAGSVCVVGCASGYGLSDRDVAKLPPGDRQQAIAAHHPVDVAHANLDTARTQRDEARQFRAIAMNELASARSRVEAARAGVEMGRTTRDTRQLRAAQGDEDLARDQLIAARAKLDYADRLLTLRESRIDACEAAVTVARVEEARKKAQLLEQDGLAANVDREKIRVDAEDAQERLAEARVRVATLDGETQQLRVAWQNRRREFNTASAAGIAPLGARAPRPMQDSRGDVNDTPNAPALPESQEPPNNIAPNP